MGDNFRLAMGLISGTSMDGIDACVIRINCNLSQGEINDFVVVDHMTVPYPHGLKEDLLRVGIEGSIKDVCLYQSLLGQLFSDAAKAMIKKLSVRSSDIYVIGSHGQTVLHLPNSIQLYGHSICGSLQLGDPSVIANQTGIITVGDFRTADIALGGQGAPLVPYLDHMLLRRHFSKTGRVGVFLNIGGISNIFSGAIADTDEDTAYIGFDCGPGNVLIDSLMKHFYGREFDKDGTVASEGTVKENLLSWLMEDEFVLRCPPKSTGRELYNPDYVDNIIKKCKQEAISSRDCISTVTAFTAHAVHYNFKHYIQSLLNDWPDSDIDLFVSGGGYKNNALVKYLKECFKLVNVASTDELGIPCDAKEAACFAVLAYQAVTGHKNHLPCVTGASGPTILGKICLVKPPGSDCSKVI